MNPPWNPWELMAPVDPTVRGQDAMDAVLAVSEAVDSLDTEGRDGMIVFRHPKAVVFLPYLQHRHDQDCNRA